MVSEQYIWDNIIKSNQEQKGLISHQIDSFNTFLSHGLSDIIDTSDVDIPGVINIKFRNVVVQRPVVYETDRKVHDLFPCDARIRDLTYSCKVYVTVCIFDYIKNETKVYHMVPLCDIPCMLMCDFCHLTKSKGTNLIEMKMNECPYDKGGYFVIKGKERVLVAQLRGSYNIPLVYQNTSNEIYCETRSMSSITGHSVLIKIYEEDRSFVFSIPYTKKTIPVGIVMAALGYCFEEDFNILLNDHIPQKKTYIRLLIKDILVNLDVDISDTSEENREHVKIAALKHIGKQSHAPIHPDKHLDYAKQVMNIEILPHMGIDVSNTEKVIFLMSMFNKLILTSVNVKKADDRDNYSFKRFETSGILCYELFRQLFKKYKDCLISIGEKQRSNIDIVSVMNRLNVITKGFHHCFSTGNWGVPKTSYIRQGVSQILSRLSYGATISHKRRISIPVGRESKNTKIRQIHPSQYGFVCPCETPEGQSVGIVLNLSLLTIVSKNVPSYLVIDVLQSFEDIVLPDVYNFENKYTSVFVNGVICCYVVDLKNFNKSFHSHRNQRVIHQDVSIVYYEIENEIHIATDAGRLLRPVFAVNKDRLFIKECMDLTWVDMVKNNYIVYRDPAEINSKVIACYPNELVNYSYDYCEISPCTMLGVMGSIIPWPDHSQSPRNCYQTSMGKQAMSMYALSHNTRYDTITHVLQYPQKPLVTTKAATLMGFSEMCSGINAVVAIACYSGFNQEDSVIVNHAAIQRGLFNATSYRTHVQNEKDEGLKKYEKIGCPPYKIRKTDINYGLLDSNGIVKKRHPNGKPVFVQKGDVIIGKYLVNNSCTSSEALNDCSLIIKKGEEGFVDRIVTTIKPDGYKLVKVVVRTERTPEVGDKIASRAAQKGTIGMIFAQEDMPWTAEGITPDIIINPHCIPSRMTINQLMESVLGKTCSIKGEIGDCTPFGNDSVNISKYLKEQLEMQNFKGDGTETLYSGFTGEKLGEIFIGLVYYQRLKHLVAEKIHARSTGPVTTLTKQPLEGRSRDGGLRVGEMERDAMIAHGTSMFMKERLCDESDPYQVPVCKICGNISTTYSKCNSCEKEDISVVGIPYISKLVIQELNSMCIKTSINC